MEQKRTSAIPRRGGNVEGASAPEYRAFLRLVRAAERTQPESYHPRHWADDFGNAKNVSACMLDTSVVEMYKTYEGV